MIPYNFEVHGKQIPGARDYQEDALFSTNFTDNEGHPAALVIVADGMGGHAAGNVASNMVIQAVSKYMTANLGNEPTPTVLKNSVIEANADLASTIAETPGLQGMGCTLVVVLLEQKGMWWASVGDSCLYLCHKNVLEKKNEDHSYGSFVTRMKKIDPSFQEDPTAAKNALMSVLMGDEIARIDISEKPIRLFPEDRIVVATDGLNTIDDVAIESCCARYSRPLDVAEELLRAVQAAAHPRQDNTTVIAVRVARPEKKSDKAADRGIRQSAGAKTTSANQEEQRARKLASTDKSSGIVKIAIGSLFLVVVLFGVLVMKGVIPKSLLTSNAPVFAPPRDATAAPSSAKTEAVTPQPDPNVLPSPLGFKRFSDRIKGGGMSPALVKLPGGKFMMGSASQYPYPKERPEHLVTISAFSISEKEITVAEYNRFARSTSRTVRRGNANDPVRQVRWKDAVAYASWLSRATGARYRLPTEAEWEYAASGGVEATYWWGTKERLDVAHCFDCRSGSGMAAPLAVGSFPPNQYSLYDTAGNVAEWVQDCWHTNYTGAPGDGRAWNEVRCEQHVVRGGGYASPIGSLRSQKRDKFFPNQGYDTVGFRIVRDLP